MGSKDASRFFVYLLEFFHRRTLWPYLLTYSIIYFYQYGLMEIYFILRVVVPSYFITQAVLTPS